MVPANVHADFLHASEQTGASLGDLGAYYILVGMAAVQREGHDTGIDLPPHLRVVAERLASAESVSPQLQLDLGVAS